MTAPRRPRKPARDWSNPRVIGYLRVSTDGQAESGAGIDAQRATIAAEAQRRGWTDVEYVTDPAWSAKDLDRPELAAALERLDRGEADVLVTAKLDRLSRSVHDLSGLLLRAERNGWRIVLLDIGVDTTTPSGRLVTTNIAGAAEYERHMIGLRTREALAAKRAAGVRLGRPATLPLDVVRRIVRERAEGRGLRVIAEGLTTDGVPTARGGHKWSTSSVQGVLAGQDAERLRIEAAAQLAVVKAGAEAEAEK
jgi:DNA invertase Pin-like site-specific DNA recombinase